LNIKSKEIKAIDGIAVLRPINNNSENPISVVMTEIAKK
jgi:hypothetical protein